MEARCLILSNKMWEQGSAKKQREPLSTVFFVLFNKSEAKQPLVQFRSIQQYTVDFLTEAQTAENRTYSTENMIHRI